MHGVGEATAAITIVNALTAGVGGAIGVEIRARAELTLRDAPGGDPVPRFRPAEAGTPLVRAALRLGLERFARHHAGGAELALASDIPSGRGLKSSSAVSSAVLLAAAKAAGRSVRPIELARLSAKVSRDSGVSATGAFDDALAGLVGGIVVTDNRDDRLILRLPLPPDLSVALWIPRTTHPPSPELRGRFAELRSEGLRAADAAIRGNWTEAMGLNSDVVDRVMGYDYGALRTDLLAHGAVAAGTSGLGPAFAAVAPTEHIRSVVRRLPATHGERKVVAFAHGFPPRAGGRR